MFQPLILFVSAITCVNPPNVGNSSVNTREAKYPDSVTFTCREGYSFQDHTQSKVSACTFTGSFEPMAVGCKG